MKLFRIYYLSSISALLTLLSVSFSFGQTLSSSPHNEVSMVFSQADFKGNFSVMAAQDDDYDYYVVDMTRLHDRFEKVYFMNLAYREDKLISLKADPNKEQLWFKTYRSNTEEEITCLFDDLRKETSDANLKLNEVDKAAWLEKNDKFTKK